MARAGRAATHKLETFLYILIHEHLPIGKLEEIKAKMKELEELELCTYSSKFIRDYTHELLFDVLLEGVKK